MFGCVGWLVGSTVHRNMNWKWSCGPTTRRLLSSIRLRSTGVSGTAINGNRYTQGATCLENLENMGVLEGDDQPTLLRENQHYLHYITIIIIIIIKIIHRVQHIQKS